MQRGKYVVPFSQLRMTDVESVGGKNASLGEMLSQLSGRRPRAGRICHHGAGLPRFPLGQQPRPANCRPPRVARRR